VSMTAFNSVAKPAALFLVLASATCVPGSARAGTGWLWFDSVFGAPTVAPAPDHHDFQRAKPVRVTTIVPVAKPIVVSVDTPQPKSDCFWCNRPVFVSGLAF
jgi:hypothetical protein